MTFITNLKINPLEVRGRFQLCIKRGCGLSSIGQTRVLGCTRLTCGAVGIDSPTVPKMFALLSGSQREHQEGLR